jgi:hypothetical protein
MIERVQGMEFEALKYPTLSENAGKWLSMTWVTRLRPVDGLYTKPHLYYA